MSFWGDVGEGTGRGYRLILCCFLFFISLILQSWVWFFITVGILLISTWDTWIWRLPGLRRQEPDFAVSLQGAAQRKLRTESPRQWLIEGARYFRGLGFFARDQALNDEALADKIAAAHREEWGDDFDATSRLADLMLLKADADRVWWQDVEADVCGENKVYERVLPEWGRISLGIFEPTEVVEVWEDERGPISIEFTAFRRRHLITPEYMDDYIDLGIIADINELIWPEGRRFEVAHTGDQTAFMVCLTPDEKARLIRERGWTFC